ncbi:MAG: response regulator, partial [Bacteroidota bacterium]
MTQPVKILLVDDEVTGREVLSLALQERGFHTSQADDGQIALEALESGTFDVVISDVLMPRMDGYRLCYEVRKSERWKGLPFIIYTGTYTAPEDERLGMEFGANKYLRKTGSVDEVVQAVKEVLSSNGMNPPPEQLGELDVMKVYSERLVKKLEEKNIELENAHARLLYSNRELTKLTEDIKNSEARLKAIIDNEPECIKLTSPDGILLDMNPAGLLMVEAESLEQVTGHKIVDLVEVHDRKRYADFHQSICKGESGILEFRLIGLRGTLRWMETHAVPLRNNAGQVISVLSVTRDISEKRHSDQKFKELAQRIIETQELERKRIARELHDSVGQMLSSVKFRIQSAGEKIQSQKSKIWKDLSGAWTLLEQSIHEIRRIAHNLRPSILDDLGLISAVRSMCEEFGERTNITVNLRSSRFPNRLPLEVELSLFRIIQEVLNNVEQHSKATKLALQIQQK